MGQHPGTPVLLSRESGGVAADGRLVTWMLKQGVRWADGEPSTADGVPFTYEAREDFGVSPIRAVSIGALWWALVVLGGAGPAAAERGVDGTLRLLLWQAPTTVNPHMSTGTKDQLASRIVYEPLASFDADGALVPLLAAEITSRENGGVAADGRSVRTFCSPMTT
jgi:ABC-type transport system substrate-binding protein